MWTPIGTSNGTHCALMNEDGMVEVDQGSCSIEPMVWIKGRLFTWAEVTSRQELLEDWMPVPSVIWETGDWSLRIQAEAGVSGGLRVRYRFQNLTDQAQSAKLFVLLRPFQVTPPWQSFRKLGGVSPIHDLAWDGRAVRVNETTLIVPIAQPAGFGAMRFDEGFMASVLLAGTPPASTEAHDPFGFATGALDFELSLQAHQICERVVSCCTARCGGIDWRAGIRLADKHCGDPMGRSMAGSRTRSMRRSRPRRTFW